MKTIWVFDDFGKGINQRDTIMLQASARLWSIFCPRDTRVLYCSESVGNTLMSLGITELFNKVIFLYREYKFNVDTRVFWSLPKLAVLLEEKEPVTIIDHDFLAFCNFREYLDPSKVYYTYTENALGYYPNSFDSLISQLSYKAHWPQQSANVSFLQLPYPEWTQFYAGTAIQVMEELTTLGAPHSKYLIFAEQMVFKHLLPLLEPGFGCLVENIYDCKTESFSLDLDPAGLWTLEESKRRFIHFGPSKSRWSKQTYDREMKWICGVSRTPLSLLERTNYLRK